MSTLREIGEIQAEIYQCRDSVALLRARLYRRGIGTNQHLEELQRRLESAQRKLHEARTTPHSSRS